jgi:hypothetical protein
VGEHHRVAVDVDDLGFRCHELSDLVGVLHGGQPGADIEELPDPGLAGQVADRADEELARLRGHGRDVRIDFQTRLADGAVDLEVVLAAHSEVPDPRRMRDIDTKEVYWLRHEVQLLGVARRCMTATPSRRHQVAATACALL